MHQHAILAHPGHSRVYFNATEKLAAAEFSALSQSFSVPCQDIRWDSLAGIGYLTFQTQSALSASDWQTLSCGSFVYALFELETDVAQPRLSPIQRTNEPFLSESFSTILKYTGKTNEQFTRMMINLAHAASRYAAEPCIRLLDPVAGKGTTLYEGLIQGHHVHGMEVGERVVNEAYHYVKKYLETERIKHVGNVIKQSGANKAFTATRYQFQISKNGKAAKDEAAKTLELIAGNSVHVRQFFPKNHFHAIVGDLPYGVQHGVVTQEKQSNLTRSPQALLEACLPAWRDVLKPGGAMALAWNLHVLPRKTMESIVTSHGFTVKYPETDFSHRVDQSIQRDVIVAQKI